MQATRFSLIERFAELTGATDNEIASIISANAAGDISRSTVQAYRTKRLPENLSDRQKDNLVQAARHYRQQVYERVAEMELYT